MYLTEQIHQQLFHEILEGKYQPGERMPTEMETAARFQASRVTVRRAYAILEKAGIIVRRKRCGTIVSSNYSGSTEKISAIAAIMPLQDEFTRDFLKVLCAESAQENILTVIEPGMENGMDLSKTVVRLVSAGIRNMVIWGLDNCYDAALFSRLRVLGVNMVFFDQIMPSGKFADYVGLNNKAGIHAIMEDAAEKGYRNYIFIGMGNLALYTNKERRNAFVSECETRGFEYSFLEIPYETEAESGLMRACQKQIRNAGAKTAVVCVNDVVALKVADILPENAVLYSIDGKKEAVARGIITYFQPMDQMAKCCLNALKQQCSKGEKWQAAEYLFEGELLRK
ncbi:MAG: GntR family transcriptional regulator [Lentisphaeria bacterium]|nr:GntR family transcriptional regulator [Lentisphaeria bacterium]